MRTATLPIVVLQITGISEIRPQVTARGTEANIAATIITAGLAISAAALITADLAIPAAVTTGIITLTITAAIRAVALAPTRPIAADLTPLKIYYPPTTCPT